LSSTSEAVLNAVPLDLEHKQQLTDGYSAFTQWVEGNVLGDLSPIQIVVLSLLSWVMLNYLISLARSLASLRKKKIMEKLFRLATYIPQVNAYITAEGQKTIVELSKKYSNIRKGKALVKMPDNGTSQTVILESIRKMSQGCRKFYTDGGNVSGAVYTNDEGHWNFISEVIRQCIVSNPLHIDEFLFVTQMEAEIIRWTLNLYRGDKDSCGLVTSGGTESILLAMLAYREQAKEEKGITKPNIVMSETAHPAFEKAAFYFRIELRKIPMTNDMKLDLKGMKRAIDSNTICLVASCPDYAFGNYDPVENIASLALSYGIGCHSDCCLGSYVNPFMDELEFEKRTECDFSVPGVTTISCDPHKYAYGPKGCSLSLFRDKKLRDYQMFINTDWNGGIYATSCMAGSRPGCVIAGTWASMMKHGRAGLKQKSHGILEAQKNIREALKDYPDITILSRDDGPIFSWTSKTVNCIALCEVMLTRRQWTLTKLQRPHGAHWAITDASACNWKDFVSALKECVELMKTEKSLNVNHDTAAYGLTA
jgi:sphinganine-1-phosphate aldolase